MSQEAEDHDHVMIDGVKIAIKPNSLYPDRDAQEPKKRADGDDDRSQTQSRVKRKFTKKMRQLKAVSRFFKFQILNIVVFRVRQKR